MQHLNQKQLIKLAQEVYKDLKDEYGPAVKTRADRVRVLANVIHNTRYPNDTEFTMEEARSAAERVVK